MLLEEFWEGGVAQVVGMAEEGAAVSVTDVVAGPTDYQGRCSLCPGHMPLTSEGTAQMRALASSSRRSQGCCSTACQGSCHSWQSLEYHLDKLVWRGEAVAMGMVMVSQGGASRFGLRVPPSRRKVSTTTKLSFMRAPPWARHSLTIITPVIDPSELIDPTESHLRSTRLK